jgi:lipopolysaccharide transport system ATP-binding protein
MNKNAISVEHLYKQYRLGMVSTGTMAHDLNRWWHKINGKSDPYELVTTENDRTKKSSNDYVWALNDINFDVNKGEVLGVIGKNGAGKSTLLKILSKVTSPTKGNIKVNGRIASLLEVGTGFHPELSGRENIYLNGAILGMSKNDIKMKFDEIVDFSGVDKYIDTPVKRYSSGMYVRLAFAVAAHLESEILIIDEVLAVGDAEFQKKSRARMDQLIASGAAVVLVSHDLTAVRELSTRTIWLEAGHVKMFGETKAVVDAYEAS